jgi:hypothetical protein
MRDHSKGRDSLEKREGFLEKRKDLDLDYKECHVL